MSANDLRSRLLTVGMRLVLGWSLALTSVWFQATAQAADANATKGAPAKAGATAVAREEAAPEPEKIESAVCLGCHGNEGFGSTGPDGKNRSLHVEPDRFGGSVHGKQACVGCHTDITEIPHKAGTGRKVSCVQCHEDLWAKAQKAGTAPQHERLGVVVQQIQRYSKSVHAKAGKDDPSRPNANCYNCHDAHYVYPKDSPGRTAWRLTVPNACEIGRAHV